MQVRRSDGPWRVGFRHLAHLGVVERRERPERKRAYANKPKHDFGPLTTDRIPNSPSKKKERIPNFLHEGSWVMTRWQMEPASSAGHHLVKCLARQSKFYSFWDQAFSTEQILFIFLYRSVPFGRKKLYWPSTNISISSLKKEKEKENGK